MATIEREVFDAMGTTAQLTVRGAPRGTGVRLRRRIEQLEQRWSRFRPDSEVSTLNVAAGDAVAVSTDTVELVTKACAGWALSGGAYDPTVLGAMVANGYDRTFVELRAAGAGLPWAMTAPGCAGIVVDAGSGRVALPEGVGFDPGGIGKGLAADIIVREALAAGAVGVLANLGGDLRVAGEPEGGDCWLVEMIEPTVLGRPLARLALRDGAVATTTDRRRRWKTRHGERHHIIDPSSGGSAVTGRAIVSAVAAEGWWAEVAATWLTIAGPGCVPPHVAALVVDDDLTTHRVGAIDRYLR